MNRSRIFTAIKTIVSGTISINSLNNIVKLLDSYCISEFFLRNFTTKTKQILDNMYQLVRTTLKQKQRYTLMTSYLKQSLQCCDTECVLFLFTHGIVNFSGALIYYNTTILIRHVRLVTSSLVEVRSIIIETLYTEFYSLLSIIIYHVFILSRKSRFFRCSPQYRMLY